MVRFLLCEQIDMILLIVILNNHATFAEHQFAQLADFLMPNLRQ